MPVTPLDAISHSIQLAVAPVFMLTAIAALLGALATRLARIIDRARTLEDRLEADVIKHEDEVYAELKLLRKRGRVVNSSMILLTLSATLIGATVIALFLVETITLRSSVVVPWTFLGGVVMFVFALLCFLGETLLAGKALNFGTRGRRR
jgi:heme/copper-type cytochrome/quinol oxidase subunit 4